MGSMLGGYLFLTHCHIHRSSGACQLSSPKLDSMRKFHPLSSVLPRSDREVRLRVLFFLPILVEPSQPKTKRSKLAPGDLVALFCYPRKRGFPLFWYAQRRRSDPKTHVCEVHATPGAEVLRAHVCSGASQVAEAHINVPKCTLANGTKDYNLRNPESLM